MALPPDFVAGLMIYRIPEDPEGLRQRRRIWKYLAPHLDDAISRHIDDLKKGAPSFERLFTELRQPYHDLLVRCGERMFTRPFDEAWVADVKERVSVEIKLGHDMRIRGPAAQAIVSGLHEGLRRSRWVSKQVAFDMADLALRVVAMDASIGINLHYQAKAHEAKAKSVKLGEAISEFSRTIQEVRGMTTSAVGSLRETAGNLAELAQSGADRAETAARAADDTASNVARMANATEELFASISNIRQQATTSAQMAYDAVAQAGRTNGTMVSLSEAVDKVGSVVGLISDIASSTNMLALNATIEASRAGDAGRGFAVVAAEVKSLARQTSQATREIGDQIAMIQVVMRRSVEQIGMGTQAITGIASMAEAVASSVDQQAGATGSIAEGVNGAARTATTVAEALRIIESTVRLTRDASQAALDLSGRLADSAYTSSVAMDALFEAAAKHEAMTKMARLSKTAN
ncbi:MAG: methyl-accepting chemotaxis protein [Beijerinckiaceae bacterium]